MKRWKQITALILALLMLMMTAAGCAGEKEETRGLKLRAAFINRPTSLDPAYAATEEERTITEHLFENLMKYSAAGLVNGQAAEYSVVKNEDGTETYTFTLRNDIYWSDGKAVTAEDFVHAWQRLAAPQVASPHSSILEVVAGYDEAIEGNVEALQVSAPDSRTFEVTLSEHCPYFLSVICTDTATMPVRADVVPAWLPVEGEEEGSTSEDEVVTEPAMLPDWTAKKATLITNGAYSVRNYNADHLTVVEKEGYYDSRRLIVKELDFFFAENLERAMSSYEKGESDFILKCGSVEGSVEAMQPEVSALAVNQMSSLSESVRQALTLALDRNAIAAAMGTKFVGLEGLVPEGITTVSGSQFRAVNGVVLPCDEEGVEKNRARARELIAPLYRGGGDIMERLGVITLVYENNFLNGRIAHQVKQQWQEVLGICVELVSITGEEMGEALGSGAFTIALMSVSDESNTVTGYLDHYVSDSPYNYGQHYSNAYDILLRAAVESESVEARDAYLADAERLLLESGYVIPLCGTTYHYLLRDGLTGLICNDMGVYNFSAVTEIVA